MESSSVPASPQPNAPPWLSLGDALTLTLMTAAAYVGAFGYEAGICRHFDIPAGLVRISIEVLIRSLLPVLGFTVVLVLYLEPLALPFVGSENRPRGVERFVIGLNVALGALAITSFLTFGVSWHALVTLLLVLVMVNVVLAVFTAFAFAWRRWGAARWPRLATVVSEAQTPTLLPFAVVGRYVGFRHIALLIFLPLCFATGALSGSRNARIWDTFYSIPSKGVIIIRHYGDIHVCKPWREGAKAVDAATIVLTTADIANTSITSHKFPHPPMLRND